MSCLAMVLGACAPTEGPSQTGFEDQVADLGVDVGSSSELTRDTEAQQVERLSGTWLQYSQLSSCVDVGSQSFDTYSRTIYLVDVEHDDFGVTRETWRGCDIDLTPLLNLQGVLKTENLETIFPVVTVGGLATSTAVGGGYASAPMAELWGLDLEDPVNDEFPSGPDDSRIIDSDGDGHPGATLVFGTNVCDAYLFQRTSTIYSGSFVAFDRIEGTAVSTTEQVIIDATTMFCKTRYDSRPNDSRNIFARQRVDGAGGSIDLDLDGDGEVTCSEVQGEHENFTPVTAALFDRIDLDDSVCSRR